MPTIECACCGEQIEVAPHRTYQQYCSKPACKAKRNQALQRRKRAAARSANASVPDPAAIEANSPKHLHLFAAEYVRMSTEHQRYSIENQQARIREYAASRGLQIVKTYADGGRSGLRLSGRAALKSLLADVVTGDAGFTRVLVYDVSRWGRFQDADESAHYEFVCRSAGFQVEYCAEQFVNDGSPMSSIVKGIKRVMAAEYSRELSEKVFAGQVRIISKGFKVGGRAGFGLRRILLDDTGKVRGEIAFGQRKSIQSDRMVLAPGPAKEVELVRQIYQWFTKERLLYAPIARRLIAMGVVPPPGCGWTSDVIHKILTSEKYVGIYVYNRTSNRLSTGLLKNPPKLWLRSRQAFTAIVDRSMYQAAQDRIANWANRQSDEELISRLQQLHAVSGYVNQDLMDRTDGVAHSQTYRTRFGSLEMAYKAAGLPSRQDWRLCAQKTYVKRRLLIQFADTAVCEMRVSGMHVTRTSPVKVNVGRDLPVLFASLTRRGGRTNWRFNIDADVEVIIAMRHGWGDPCPELFLFPRRSFPSAKSCAAWRDSPSPLDQFRTNLQEVAEALRHWRRE